jgi:hypothetical protein
MVEIQTNKKEEEHPCHYASYISRVNLLDGAFFPMVGKGQETMNELSRLN